MSLAALLREDLILLGLEARDKWAALDRCVSLLVEQGRIKPEHRKPVLDALVARENVASTGMGHGIAIPHAWIDLLDSASAVVALSPAGIPFQAPDGKPATITILLVSPRRNAQSHVKTLASIARLLNYEELRQALLAAKSPAEALRIVKEAEDKEFG